MHKAIIVSLASIVAITAFTDVSFAQSSRGGHSGGGNDGRGEYLARTYQGRHPDRIRYRERSDCGYKTVRIYDSYGDYQVERVRLCGQWDAADY